MCLRRGNGKWVGVGPLKCSLLALLCCGLLLRPVGAEEIGEQILLFNEKTGTGLQFSWYDVADPLASGPHPLLIMESVEKRRCLGLYNGMLYFLTVERVLEGIDTQTGERFRSDGPLSDTQVVEHGVIYLPPGPDSGGALGIIDLRERSKRDLHPPVRDEAEGWRVWSRTRNGVFTLLHRDPVSNGTELNIPCRIEDLRQPDRTPLLFDLHVLRPRWQLDPSTGWPSGSESLVTLRPEDPARAVVFQWLPDGQFACVGTGLLLDGARIPADGEPGAFYLFVGDMEARAVRSLPLIDLEGGAVLRAPDSPGATPGVTVDTDRMELVKEVSRQARFQGMHFNAPSTPGIPGVLHGAEPLALGAQDPVTRWEIDQSGERVLVRTQQAAACYDVYFGYHATARPADYYAFADRHDLDHEPVALTDGAAPLWAGPVPGATVEVAGGAGFPGIRRVGRAEAFQLIASSDLATYPEGAVVTVDIKLQYTGEAPAWTDPPVPMFPVLTGTLRGPASSLRIMDLPGVAPATMPGPLLMRNGERYSHTLELRDLAPGEYKLALAYAGGDGGAWRGLARAPLVMFQVGKSEDSETARLRYLAQEALKLTGYHYNGPVYTELRQAGRKAAPFIQEVLRAAEPRSGGGGEPALGLSTLFDMLRMMYWPELVPFYAEMMNSGDADKRTSSYFAARALYPRLKEESLKETLCAAVKSAYDDQRPIEKARAMVEFEREFWPGLYEALKRQITEGTVDEQREAIGTLAHYYPRAHPVFDADQEAVVVAILENTTSGGRWQAVQMLEYLYRKDIDRDEVCRAIDRYRVAYPESFGYNRLKDQNDLWDVAWLGRADADPTEARFALLQRSKAQLEAHCGPAGDGFPESWAAMGDNEAARKAYTETLQAWAACFRERPATFRVPVLSY